MKQRFFVVLPMPAFHRPYLACTLALLAVEAAIARWAHDALIRPYGGDLLAVGLVYCALRSLWPLPVRWAALAALLLAYALEYAQYRHLLAGLGWQHSALARLVLGIGFDWGDVLAYTLGAAAVLAAEAGARRGVAR